MAARSQFILNHLRQNGGSQSSNRSIPVAAAKTPKKPAITSGAAALENLSEGITWSTWQEFRDAQAELVLPANTAAHIPVTIRYIDRGEAQLGTILLMHGIPTWGYLYHAVIPTLVQAGYRVLAPDFLGHGWSDRRDRFDRSFQDQARMIVALLSSLKLEQVNVVGHDTGVAVALILAIEHPKIVKRLMIANSVCYDRFDDDMLDFGHPLRWKPRSIGNLVEAIESSLAAGLSNPSRLTPQFREG